MARNREDPSTEQVLELLTPCEPYTASEIADHFSQASRWTVQRRLDELVEEDTIEKKKHSANRVSYWRYPE